MLLRRDLQILSSEHHSYCFKNRLEKSTLSIPILHLLMPFFDKTKSEIGNSSFFHSTLMELDRSCEKKIGVTTLHIKELYQNSLQLRRLLRSCTKNSLLLGELTPELPISEQNALPDSS